MIAARRFLPNKSRFGIDRALRIVVRSAERHVVTYRRLLEHSGVSTDSIRGVADLPRLPVLSKVAVFRDAPLEESIHDRASISKCVRAGTSGSTGLPVNIYMSRAEAWFRSIQLAAAWRRLARFPPVFRVADVGSWVANDAGGEVVRRGSVSVLRVSIGLPLARQADLVRRHRPHVISGYPTALGLLAEHFAEASKISVPLVATRGEVLHSSIRTLIETGFSGHVADFYNCEEVGNVASECPAIPRILHINTDVCVVETVDEHGLPTPAGVEGRILLTNLFNCTMPFIRYDIRDRGTVLPHSGEPCACGSRRPAMQILGGRDDDYVYLPDGRRVSPRLVATAVNRSFGELTRQGGFDRFFRRFQIIQDERAHLTIRVIPEAGVRVDLSSVIDAGLRRLHSELRSTVVLVDELPLEPSGKFKKVIRTYDPEAPTVKGQSFSP